MEDKELIRRVRNSIRAKKSQAQILNGFLDKGYKLEYAEKIIAKAKLPKRVFGIFVLFFIVFFSISIASYTLFSNNEKGNLKNPLDSLSVTGNVVGLGVGDLSDIESIEITPEFISYLLNEVGVWRLHAHPITFEKPLIITNVGGFSESAFLPEQDKEQMYKKIAQALNLVDSSGVEIVIQTMPPFPWHFGGQSHHNLFVNHDEIEKFCSENGYRVCLDVSHSQMACSYYHWSMDDFVKKISPYIAYLHVVDALGIDGEGVQIGKGDVDFVQLSKNLDELAPESEFIPEVWQGHKQNGSGFWEALEFLEQYL